ncbi:MAG: hypothetical protein LC777_18215 [Actinobacteria bacterium]|nr:hypothetical protein [Actinomycetota bacterium]
MRPRRRRQRPQRAPRRIARLDGPLAGEHDQRPVAAAHRDTIHQPRDGEAPHMVAGDALAAAHHQRQRFGR